MVDEWDMNAFVLVFASPFLLALVLAGAFMILRGRERREGGLGDVEGGGKGKGRD